MRFGMTKVLFVIAIVIIVASFAFRGALIGNALQSGKHIYQIEVFNFNQTELYYATEYVIDSKSNCISFKDVMGMHRTVCNKYTLTEY